MIQEKSGEWPEQVAGLLKQYDYDAPKALMAMGMIIQEELQGAIINFVGVPLAPATIEKKGFSKPLVDSGHLLDSVEARVVTDAEE